MCKTFHFSECIKTVSYIFVGAASPLSASCTLPVTDWYNTPQWTVPWVSPTTTVLSMKRCVTNPTVYNRSIYKYNLIDACINVFLESLERKFMLAIFIFGVNIELHLILVTCL